MEQARIEHAPNGSLLTYITIADAMVNYERNSSILKTIKVSTHTAENPDVLKNRGLMVLKFHMEYPLAKTI